MFIKPHAPYFYASVAVALFFGCYFLFFTSTFETNDDVYMMLFASGFYLGQPSEYILPSGVFLGLFLKELYKNFPEINWYTLHLVGCHVIAFWILAVVFLRKRVAWVVILTGIFLMLLFESYFLVYIQFTTTAFLLSIAGIVAWMDMLNTKKYPILSMLGIILLQIWAGQLREKVPMAVILFSLPFLLFYAWESELLLPLVASLVVLGVALAFSFQLEYGYQGDIGRWGDHKALFDQGFYPAYNHPNMAYDSTLAVFDQLKWSQNDFYLFKSNFFEEMPKYSMENLAILSQTFKEKPQSIIPVFQQLMGILWAYKYLTMFTLGLVVSFHFQPERKFVWVAWVLVMVFFATQLFLGQTLILKPRVVLPFLWAMNVFLLLIWAQNEDLHPKVRWINHPISWLIPIVLSGGVFIRLLWNDYQNVKPRINAYRSIYKALEKNSPGTVKVVWGTSLPIDHVDIWENFYADKPKTSLYLMLANLGYWQNPQLLAVHGEKNIYKALIENKKFVLLLAENRQHLLPYLSTFYKENWNISIQITKVLTLRPIHSPQDGFGLYRIQYAPTPGL